VAGAELRLEGNGFPVMFDGLVESSLVIQDLSQADVGFCMFGISLETSWNWRAAASSSPVFRKIRPELKRAGSCCRSRNSASPNLPIASS
jgi:hypothetical protein